MLFLNTYKAWYLSWSKDERDGSSPIAAPDAPSAARIDTTSRPHPAPIPPAVTPSSERTPAPPDQDQDLNVRFRPYHASAARLILYCSERVIALLNTELQKYAVYLLQLHHSPLLETDAHAYIRDCRVRV